MKISVLLPIEDMVSTMDAISDEFCLEELRRILMKNKCMFSRVSVRVETTYESDTYYLFQTRYSNKFGIFHTTSVFFHATPPLSGALDVIVTC